MLQNPYEENHKNLLTDIKRDFNKWRCVLPVSLCVIKMSVLSKVMYHFTPFQSASQLGFSFFLFLDCVKLFSNMNMLAGIAKKFLEMMHNRGDLHFQI